MEKYRHLNAEDRFQIEALKQLGYSQMQMALKIGCSQSAISRELKRNTGKRGYRHKQAERFASARKEVARRQSKFTAQLNYLIERYLKESWSPEQISGYMQHAGEANISCKAIYQRIHEDKCVGGKLYEHLRCKGKNYKPRKASTDKRGQIKGRVSIANRPEVVANKERIGDWEADLIIGNGHSGAILTLVERVTKQTLLRKLSGKTAEEVSNAIIEALRPYHLACLTITNDNGKEFAMHKRVSDELGTDVYFADPYNTNQRALVENTNKLVREFLPKNKPFHDVTTAHVMEIERKLNHRPRKYLGFKKPSDLFHAYVSSLAA
jgi:IS30 family transposase